MALIKLFLYLSMLFLLAGVGWFYGKHYVPIEYRKMEPVVIFDEVVEAARHEVAQRLGLDIYIVKPDKVFVFSAKEFKQLVNRALQKKPALMIYVYDFSCILCSLHVEEVNQLALEYQGNKQITILPVAVLNNASTLAIELSKRLEELHFKPLMVNASSEELDEMFATLLSGDRKIPIMTLVGRGGFSKQISIARAKRESIIKEIEEFI